MKEDPAGNGYKGPESRALKGRGSWTGNPGGLFGALHTDPSQLCVGVPRVQPWDSRPSGSWRKWLDSLGRGYHCSHRQNAHLCPAPTAPLPMSPRSRAEIAHKWPETSDEDKRAPNHVPREAGPGGDGGGTGLPKEAAPWGYLIPPGGTPALQLFLSPFTATLPRMPPLEKSYYAKIESLGT